MKKLLLGLTGALLLTGACAHAASSGSSAPAAPAADSSGPAIKEGAPGRYTVVPGDTLWDISGRYLKSPWRWRELWAANQQIPNPNLIYPGDVLVLCLVNNKAEVAVDQGHGCADIPGATPYPTAATTPGTPAVTGSGRDFVLHPQIRSEPLSVAIPTIPLAAIKAYLTNSRVIDYGTLERAPYIMAGPSSRVVAGTGDAIYARGKGLDVGNYGIYRGGERYVDPDTGEVLGYEATAIGAGSVSGIENGIATVNVTKTYGGEVRIEDRLLPLEELAAQPTFEPRNPEHVRPGRVLHIFNSLNSAAVDNILVLNRGKRDGVKLGDTFDVFRRGDVVEDRMTQEHVRLPSSSEGMAMVFRTFDKVSYALVLKATKVIANGDEIRPPIATDN